MIFLLLTFWLAYSCFLLGSLTNWHLAKTAVQQPKAPPSVSIIVAARNEEHTLPFLLASLEKQYYPANLLEVIIVDDCSEDNTVSVTRKWMENNTLAATLLHAAPGSLTPKKAALQKAVAHSKGEILLFTDADCTALPHWVSAMVEKFYISATGLTFGPIRYAKGNFLEKMLSQEQAALLGSACFTLHASIPTMCNGANMAVRRSVYESVNGFNTTKLAASGDDELLFHKVFMTNNEAVHFIKDTRAIITTSCPATLNELFHQRKRWAGKWEKYLLKRTKSVALFVFLFHASWITSWLYAVEEPSFRDVFLAFAGIKALLEFLFIARIMSFLDKKINLPAFLLLQMVYSLYVVFFGVVARGTTFQWKGRALN